MPPRKKKENKNKFLGTSEIKKIWRSMPPGQWYTILSTIAPDFNWTLNGVTISACCPYHNESTPSFKLQPSRGFGKCFGSCGKFVHDPVELVKHLKKCTYTEALLYLVNNHKLPLPKTSMEEDLTAYHKLQEMKKSAAIAFNKLITEFICEPDGDLRYLCAGVVYLINARKLDATVIHRLPVGVFGKPEHVKRHIPAEYHALYDDYFGGTSEAAKKQWGCVVFHYNDSTGTISQYKMRHLGSQEVIGKLYKSNIKNWRDFNSSEAKELIHHSFHYLPDPYAEARGIYGMHKHNKFIGGMGSDAYVTEGEFDALAVMNAQEVAGKVDFMVLATGGSANDISFLLDSDIKFIWLVPDHPGKKGDEYAFGVLRDHKVTSVVSTQPKLQFRVFQWPATMKGLDLDEAVLLNGYDNVFQHLYRDRNEYFLNANVWVTKKCEHEMEELHNKMLLKIEGLDSAAKNYQDMRGNMEDAGRAEMQACLLKWVKGIPDSIEKANFARKFCDKYGIDITQADEVHTSMYQLDTYEGCSEALKSGLCELFAMPYYVNTPAGQQMVLWSKDRFEYFNVNLTHIDEHIALYAGTDMISWAKGLLRDAPYVQQEDNSMASYRTYSRDIRELLKTSVQKMYGQAKPLDSLQPVGQGIHYAFLPASAHVEGDIYFVNGTKVFKGKYQPEDHILDWSFINNIVDGDIVFQVTKRDKWSFVNDVPDLLEANRVDIRELFNSLKEILNGWRFQNHEVTVEYLASWIMSIPVQKACGKINITYVTGDSNSGKTSLARGLLGGNRGGHEVPSIMEAAVFRSDASPAGMYQEMSSSALMFIIDEAESSDEHNTDHDDRTKEIQRMCYSIPHGGHTISRGGATPDKKLEYHLQMPVLMCGININNDPVFLSRVTTIYTEKDPDRMNLGDYIDDIIKNRDDITRIKRQLTVALTPYIPALMDTIQRLQRELSTIEFSTRITGRFLDCILPALSVYDLLGGNATELYKGMVQANIGRLEAVCVNTPGMNLLHSVLYSKFIRVASDDSLTPYIDARTLILQGDDQALNNSNVGIYWYVEYGWIIIVWRQVKYSHAFARSKYSTLSEASLRNLCSKEHFVNNNVSKKDHKDIVKRMGLHDIKNSSEYTIVYASYILDFEPTRNDDMCSVDKVKEPILEMVEEKVSVEADYIEPDDSMKPKQKQFSKWDLAPINQDGQV